MEKMAVDSMTSKPVYDEAFGIVPILPVEASHCFLLVQQQQGHWGFPKGHAEPGETPQETACREFVEETGIQQFQLIEGLTFSERYRFIHKKQVFKKTVLYFPALVHSAQVNYQTTEIKAYLWADFEVAITRLTYEGARRILVEVQNYLLNQAS
jgi:8-oxo-dGTP pyrophosphatase MutT (NUDIX family)